MKKETFYIPFDESVPELQRWLESRKNRLDKMIEINAPHDLIILAEALVEEAALIVNERKKIQAQ